MPKVRPILEEYGLNHCEKTILCLGGQVNKIKGPCDWRCRRQVHCVGIYQREEALLRMKT